MPEGQIYVCPTCRLLQAPSEICSDCGAPAGWIEAERELLTFLPEGRRAPDWVRPAAAIVGGLSIIGVAVAGFFAPATTAIAVGGTTGLGAAISYKLRRKSTATAIPLPPAAVVAGAVRRAGTAHRLTGTLRGIGDGEPVLAEQIVICDRHRGLYFRKVNATPFIVDHEGARTVVTGTMRVQGPPPPLESVASDDPRLAGLGIPEGLVRDPRIAIERIRDGDAVAVTGAVETEAIPELAVYRDEGMGDVMRGRMGALLVLDRAL